MNFSRRQFLGSSLLVLGSTLLEALSTPLWRWNRSLTVRAGADASSALATGDDAAKREVHSPESPVQFVDVARQAGLTIPNVWGGTEHKRYIIEAKGSGIAFFDYDQDGWLDIYLTNGTRFNEKWPAGQAPTSHLYKNNRDGTFTDVTEKSGLGRTGWQTGVCVGDYDNDGWDDLFCCFWGHNILFHNNGDGTFTDVSRKAGVYDERVRWGSGCTFLDYDRDGHLDLFVCNYIQLDPEKTGAPGESATCQWKGIPVMCGPRGLTGDTSVLYHNNGDGTFSDVTFASGIGINNQYVAWGCGFVDYDNDGWTDIIQVNGHVYPEIAGHEIGQSFKNPRLVYKNMGNGQFKDVSTSMGPGISERYSSRGAAFGDYDNDGDIDALVLNMNDVPSLLRNDGGNKQNWIKIKLVGTKCNRTAIGARVRMVSGNHAQMDEVRSGSSVMSQSDLRLHFGLGKVQTIDLIEVKWPTTQKLEKFTNVKANQILTIREGSGIVELPRAPKSGK